MFAFDNTRVMRRTGIAAVMLAAFGFCATRAGAQTYGFATMQPGTLNHTTGVGDRQGAEGEGRAQRAGAADGGRERDHPDGGARRSRDRHRQYRRRSQPAVEGGASRRTLRLIGSIHPLRVGVLRAQGQRHAHDRRSQGQARSPLGYSAMRTIDRAGRAPCWRPAA